MRLCYWHCGLFYLLFTCQESVGVEVSSARAASVPWLCIHLVRLQAPSEPVAVWLRAGGDGVGLGYPSRAGRRKCTHTGSS